MLERWLGLQTAPSGRLERTSGARKGKSCSSTWAGQYGRISKISCTTSKVHRKFPKNERLRKDKEQVLAWSIGREIMETTNGNGKNRQGEISWRVFKPAIADERCGSAT
jgi:hypothetical protein